MEGRKNQYFEISKIIKNQHLSSTCSEGISAKNSGRGIIISPQINDLQRT
jgi:hypothetical protein